MTVTHSISGCLEEAIGSAGLQRHELGCWLDKLRPPLDKLSREARQRSLPHIGVLYEKDDIAEARAAYDRLVEGADVVVIFGTGGSSLGGQALAQLGGWFIPGDDRTGKNGRPRLRFYDNLDALSLSKGLDILNLERTRFVVISKSGGTAETLSQALIAIDRVKRQGLEAKLPELFLALTEPEKPGVANGLRELMTTLGAPILSHRTDIGGRYSAFTNVGMIPAFARGLDFEAFRAGGRAVVEQLEDAKGDPLQFPPAVGAALAVAFARERGVKVNVLMPYADRLARFSHWYVQLWAESLGKNDSEGTTPVGALGPVDQHSQLQLYLGGAQHHLMTIIRHASVPEVDTPPIPADLADLAGAPYLAGHTVGELVLAQTQAIGDAFIAHKRPVRIIEIERLDEWTLGWLMMHYVLETILAASLLGVDPFDQPAVELGKRLTKDYLARMATGVGHHADTSASAGADQPDRGG
jgi:glucose-6-phosphate isomerase